MGKATRWFKSLLGMKKEKDKEFSSNLSDHQRDNKKRWSFGKSVRDSVCVGHFPPETNFNNPADTEETETETTTTTTTTNTNATSTWVKSSSSYYNSETENEQNKHAIAVAAATAAAADAAVAAAHAAVAVVRLTSHGRGTLFNGANEKWAAVKIQTIFRGYLAKKALRALKGLVKLQALVRGYLVRKQADATLHSMQALIRAQFTIRSQKARYQLNQEQQRAYPPEFRPRRSTERYDDARSEHSAAIHHSRRLSASLEAAINTFEETPKIVEIDTCRPKSSRSRRTANNSISDYGEDPSYPARMDSPRLQACPKPARMSIPDCRNFQEFDWTLAADECRFSTAQSTPRFINSCNAPVTPSKSVCTERLFRPYSNFPNYMANTQSFKAKVRSYSAPKQRPETGSRKRLSLSEIAESRASLSGVRMQRSCSQAQEAISFKNAVMGKLDRSSEFGVSDIEREYIQRRW